MHSAPESGFERAKRHECSDGNTRTRTSWPQSIVSPPETGSSCAAGTPFSRRTRVVSYEPTIVAPAFVAIVSAPSMWS